MKQTNKEDFSQLFIPVHGLPMNKNLVNEFKQLKHVEFASYGGTGKMPTNKVIRYIAYLYSEKSPLVKIHRQDLQMRKEEAAVLAGFKQEDIREWGRVKKNLFELQDYDILKMIMRFLILQSNRVWTLICAKEQMFYEYNTMLMDQLDGDKEKDRYQTLTFKTKISEESMNMLDDIDSLYDKLIGEDNEDVKEAYAKDTSLQQHFFTPEIAAKKLNG